ncbi:MAG: response regulator, partial [Rhodocyclaceae bacterium]|nr:response regulator [Rhodocyclaceae bacterium]
NSLSRSLKRHTEVDDLVRAIRSEASHGTGGAGALRPVSIQATASPAHALRLAEIIDFACIVCDYRMPEMDGGELLKRFAFKQPDCSRILISGAIDLATLVLVLNRAHIFAFLEKPWSDYDLKTNVLLGITRYRMLKENRQLAERVG